MCVLGGGAASKECQRTMSSEFCTSQTPGKSIFPCILSSVKSAGFDMPGMFLHDFI